MSDGAVTVVLPCLNEAASLPGVLSRVPSGYHSLVVDNNSTDGTADVARRHGDEVVAEPRPGLRSGHIPGSLSLPYNNLFYAATGTMKSTDELRAAFLGAGVKLDAPIVTSCGSGVSAAVLTLALYRLGIENPALYDGSWTEWGGRDDTPVER